MNYAEFKEKLNSFIRNDEEIENMNQGKVSFFHTTTKKSRV